MGQAKDSKSSEKVRARGGSGQGLQELREGKDKGGAGQGLQELREGKDKGGAGQGTPRAQRR